MAGLVGVMSAEPVSLGLVRAMIQAARHSPAQVGSSDTDGRFGIGTISGPSDQPQSHMASDDGRYHLTLVGEVYEPWAAQADHVATALLRRFRREGLRGLTDLNGAYVIVLWDHLEQRVWLINDRLGLCRVFLWRGARSFAWASELKSLLVLPEVSRAIDELALAELFVLGHPQHERSLLRDVQRLPAASVACWHEGALTIEAYWKPEFKADPSLRDLDQAADAYAECMREAVARRIGPTDHPILMLSGGLDSRTLAGMARLVRPDAPLQSITAGHGHAYDVRFGRELARIVRSRHTTVEIPTTFFQEQAAAYTWLADGQVAATGCHRMCVVAARGPEGLVINGFLGDVLGGTNRLEAVRHLGQLTQILDAGYAYYASHRDGELLRRVLQRRVYERVAGLPRREFIARLMGVSVEHPADRLSHAAIQDQLTGESSLQLTAAARHGRVAAPFTDRHLVDLVLRLPLECRRDKAAYRRMICRQFPALARVGWSGGGLPLAHSRLRAALHWRQVRFMRAALPAMTGGRVHPHPYGDYVHCQEWFRSANRAFIERTLIGNPRLAGYMDPEGVRGFLREFFAPAAPQRDLSGAVGSLVSFALFLQQMDRVPTHHDVVRAQPVLAEGQG